jgi:hypothetical protein
MAKPRRVVEETAVLVELHQDNFLLLAMRVAQEQFFFVSTLSNRQGVFDDHCKSRWLL